MSRLCALIRARLLKICVIFTRFTPFVCRIRERKIAKLWKTIKKALFRFKPFFASCDGQIFELWKGRVILPPRDDTRDVPRLYSTENFKLDFRLKPDFLYNERSSNGLEYWSIWRNTKIAGKTMFRPSSLKKLEKRTSMDASFKR